MTPGRSGGQIYEVVFTHGGWGGLQGGDKGCIRVNDGAAESSAFLTSVVNDESWHHVAFMKDVVGRELRIYVDGGPEDSIKAS